MQVVIHELPEFVNNAGYLSPMCQGMGVLQEIFGERCESVRKKAYV